MKKIFLLLLLSACSTTAPIDTTTNAINESVVALEKTLGPQCRTEAINAQINAIKTQIKSIPEICKAEIKKIEQERNYWRLAFSATFLILIWIIVRKFV